MFEKRVTMVVWKVTESSNKVAKFPPQRAHAVTRDSTCTAPSAGARAGDTGTPGSCVNKKLIVLNETMFVGDILLFTDYHVWNQVIQSGWTCVVNGYLNILERSSAP